MYIPKAFQQEDPALLDQLIKDFPFGTLVTHTESGLDAQHLPFLLADEQHKKVLKAHISKGNPLWKQVQEDSEVLAIFHGPNGYVSPNFYPTKLESGKGVPTWNYAVVHVKGRVRFTQDPEWIKSLIDELTAQHEASQEKPWSTADAPGGYIEKMLPAIVGLEIEVTSITGKWKLSQNQPEQNQQGVIAGLATRAQPQELTLSGLMQSLLEKEQATEL
ncbi:FMN-binding negative transcriptional regulator [Microbulbifer aggregans]|uniref:FMN-binding negative transcriptional regulator n=1 Tax=Microbulbifer aggregans TaxID=1769779 RepID=UPI001CFD323F|nr:FMN-binding negative transcriptional regulator [Microbulbifer aggregans]